MYWKYQRLDPRVPQVWGIIRCSFFQEKPQNATIADVPCTLGPIHFYRCHPLHIHVIRNTQKRALIQLTSLKSTKPPVY